MSSVITKSIKFGGPAKYKIIVLGKLSETLLDSFDGLSFEYTINKDGISTTLLRVRIKDQAELSGILNAIYNWRFSVLLIECEGEI